MLLNKVNLIGRVTKEPQMQQTSGNRSFVAFNIAVKRLSKDANGNYGSDIIPCEVWGKSAANFVKYAAKGTLIAVEAELRVDHFTDKNGNNAMRMRVLVNSWENLESRQTTMTRQGNQQNQNQMQGNYSNNQSNNFGNNNFQNQSQGNYQQGSQPQNQGNFNNRPNSVPGENLDNPPQW